MTSQDGIAAVRFAVRLRLLAVVAVVAAGLAACDRDSSTVEEASAPAESTTTTTTPPVALAPIEGPGYTPTGPIVADLGFRPNQHGFLFQNYGEALADGSTPTNMTAEDMRVMFGDGVCLDEATGTCTLIPEAQAWLDDANAQMAPGHCYGFAVASVLMWRDAVEPVTYGAPETPALEILDNAALQNEIAYDWALQLLESVQAKGIAGTPTNVLTTLREVLKPDAEEVYTLALWKEDFSAGHAVTPYAVEDRGGGFFNVLLYDNNWPNETRVMAFDTNTDSWSFDAALNPDEPTELYAGRSDTNNLVLFPTRPGLGVQPCPFCSDRGPVGRDSAARSATGSATGSASSTSTATIYLRGRPTDNADIVVTDDDGRRLGRIDGRIVEEIPGGQVRPLVAEPTWSLDLPPRIVVPADRRYTITVDGQRLRATDRVAVGIIGPSFNVEMRDIEVRRGDRHALVVGPDAETITYRGSRDHTPTLRVGVSEAGSAFGFEIANLLQEKNGVTKIGLPVAGGRFSITRDGSTRAARLGVEVARYTERGVERFQHDGVQLDGDARADLRFGAWRGGDAPLRLAITRDSRTTTTDLSNED